MKKDIELKVVKLSLEDAKEISKWKYEKEYSIYNYLDWDSMVLSNWAITMEEKRDKEFIKIIDQDNNFIGYARLKELDNKIYLGLGMNPTYTGNGLGKIFLQTIINYIKLNNVELEVRTFNERAIKCYNSVGFNIVKKIKKDTLSGIDEFYIMKLEK